MKYTHIGIDDQAKAVSKLPWQRNGNTDSKPEETRDDREEAVSAALCQRKKTP